MKILMTLSRIPYPLEKGDKLRAYHQIKSFLEEGISLTVVCFHFEKARPEVLQHLQSLGGQWHFIALDRWRVPLQFLRILWTPLPLQVLLFYNHKAHNQLKRILRDFQPDHIYAQLIRTAEYVKEEAIIDKTLDYMDAFSSGLQRRASHAPWYQRWLFQWEAKRVKQYEHGVYHYFDHHTIISQNDADSTEIAHKISIISNGIDPSFIHSEKVHERPQSVVFTGNMSYPPNVEAALRLGSRIMPLVWKERPSVRLIIAGAEPHRSIKGQLTDERIEITGWVPDIKVAYQKGGLFVAPMSLGSGMQNKIIEALAMGLPVICSSLVSKAFHHDVQVLLDIQETDESFSKSILQRLDPSFGYDVAHAKQIILKHFSWSETSQQLLQLMQR